jgi:hypothetical protein
LGSEVLRELHNGGFGASDVGDVGAGIHGLPHRFRHDRGDPKLRVTPVRTGFVAIAARIRPVRPARDDIRIVW